MVRALEAEETANSFPASAFRSCPCEDRIGTGPPRARTEVIYVDCGCRAIAGQAREVREAPGRSSFSTEFIASIVY